MNAFKYCPSLLPPTHHSSPTSHPSLLPYLPPITPPLPPSITPLLPPTHHSSPTSHHHSSPTSHPSLLPYVPPITPPTSLPSLLPYLPPITPPLSPTHHSSLPPPITPPYLLPSLLPYIPPITPPLPPTHHSSPTSHPSLLPYLPPSHLPYLPPITPPLPPTHHSSLLPPRVDLHSSDETGSQVPISSVLSPLSLVACVRVDSFFDRSLMDTCVVCLHCLEAELYLLHLGRSGEGKNGLGTIRWAGDHVALHVDIWCPVIIACCHYIILGIVWLQAMETDLFNWRCHALLFTRVMALSI